MEIWQERERQTELQGSITVFLTLLFGVILSVIVVTFEHVRLFTAKGYLWTASEEAAMAAFGNYNRELYEEYGLFGYGGYDGGGGTVLSEEFDNNLKSNLQASPEGREGEYTDLYRMQNVLSRIKDMEYLTQKKIFYRQIEAYLLSAAVSDVSEQLIEQYSGAGKKATKQEMEEGLDMTKQYEEDEDASIDGAESEETGESGQAGSVQTVRDEAQGNPLKTFRDFIRNGILSLVCDEKSLSNTAVEVAYGEYEDTGEKKEEGNSTADLLRGLLRSGSNGTDDHLIDVAKQKGELICYAQQVFGCYSQSEGHAASYELEYLITGKEEERDNLLGVVNRLLLIRTAVNFVYVNTDPALAAKSMATATSIAGVIAVPPLITAIQKTILLILAVEESCVDITALLEGKSVPLVKNNSNFKMKYEEICRAGRSLFRNKADSYPKASGKLTAGQFGYSHYLWIFMAMVPEQNLRCRVYDMIQFDLRTRFNQTFSLDQCITGIQYHASCEMPFLWKGLLPQEMQKSIFGQEASAWYRYR